MPLGCTIRSYYDVGGDKSAKGHHDDDKQEAGQNTRLTRDEGVWIVGVTVIRARPSAASPAAAAIPTRITPTAAFGRVWAAHRAAPAFLLLFLGFRESFDSSDLHAIACPLPLR